jgi:hypothetical protein
MRLDFWNNPIVVSAFRVKYRRSGPFAVTCLYVLALAVLGLLLQHYQDRLAYPWLRVYLVALVSAQFVISAGLAVTSTSTSMTQEVANRTLDFQRIATLSPSQILLGKLLGEPAIAFLLAIASIPLAISCWLFGAASLPVIGLLYINIITTTLMLGALGLMNRLEAPESAAQTGMGCGMGTMVVIVVLQFLMQLRFMLSNPWSEAFVGLFTPIPSIYGLLQNTPWERGLPVFGRKIPYLLVTPVAQLATTIWFFRIMTRRLVNPLSTSLSKRFAYAMLAGIDVLAAATLYDAAPVIVDPARLTAIFCVFHLMVAALLVWAITPWRESLLSWVWRFRGRLPRVVDLVRGERSENGVALLIFAAIGMVVLVPFVLVPAALIHPRVYLDAWPTIASVAAVTVLLLVSVGTWYQWVLLIAGRSGGIALVVLLAMIVCIPHMVGEYYDLDLLRSFSPTAHYLQWLMAGQPLPLYPLVIVYGSILIAARLSLTARLRGHVAVVERKLERMKHEDVSHGLPQAT